MKIFSQDFNCIRGDTFKIYLKIKRANYDFLGSQIKMQVRKKICNSKIMDFTPFLTFGTDEITFTLEKTATEMATMPVGIFKYDMELTSGNGFVQTIMKGNFVIEEDVTNDDGL